MKSLPNGLSAFFGEMGPFLEGQESQETLEERLGPGRGGPRRLEFYRELMAANQRRVLAHLFPGTRSGLGAEEWARQASAYNRSHRSDAWNLNEHGRAFPEHLGEGSPAWSECADLEWLEYQLSVHPGEFDPARDRVNPVLAVRLYRHRVDLWLAALRRGERLAAPQPEPVTLLLYRDAELRIARCRPTREMLLVFAEACGSIELDHPEALGLTPGSLADARGALRRLGVLGRGP